MHPFPLLRFLALLLVANGAPLVAGRLLGDRFARPLDGGIRLADGEPLFGASKTIRGIVASVVTSAGAAPLLGLDWTLGALAAAAAMVGDLVSSFFKRRLHLQPSSRATGLDQIPESLLPLIICRAFIGLTWLDVIAGAALFFAGDFVLSRLFYRLGMRRNPY